MRRLSLGGTGWLQKAVYSNGVLCGSPAWRWLWVVTVMVEVVEVVVGGRGGGLWSFVVRTVCMG